MSQLFLQLFDPYTGKRSATIFSPGRVALAAANAPLYLWNGQHPSLVVDREGTEGHSPDEIMELYHAAAEEYLQDALTTYLHGSGWNGSWCVDHNSEGFVAYIDYQLMDESGYYDGWVQITVKIDRHLQVQDVAHDGGEEVENKYDLEEYLWDCAQDTLYNIREQVLTEYLVHHYPVVNPRCEHGLHVSTDGPGHCQECDWCPSCRAIRRFDTENCTVCGYVWGVGKTT